MIGRAVRRLCGVEGVEGKVLFDFFLPVLVIVLVFYLADGFLFAITVG